MQQTDMVKKYTGNAPAKIILFGEHAVVYGQPAIAAPVGNLRVSATADTSTSGFLTIFARDLGRTYKVKQTKTLSREPLEMICQLILRHFDAPVPSLDLHLVSQIPIASGLGSGAAISAALARTLATAIGEEIANDDLNPMVYEVEKIHHGTPSGIDNTVIVYEQLIRYVKDQSIQRITLNHPYHFVIADTGIHAPTYLSVGDVRKLMEQKPEATKVVESIGCVAENALTALLSGDSAEAGALMNENHELLKTLTVSSNELDHLVNAAINAGALGAKLSGGGRGGNMIALVDEENIQTVKEALTAAGAYRVLDMSIGKTDS